MLPHTPAQRPPVRKHPDQPVCKASALLAEVEGLPHPRPHAVRTDHQIGRQPRPVVQQQRAIGDRANCRRASNDLRPRAPRRVKHRGVEMLPRHGVERIRARGIDRLDRGLHVVGARLVAWRPARPVRHAVIGAKRPQHQQPVRPDVDAGAERPAASGSSRAPARSSRAGTGRSPPRDRRSPRRRSRRDVKRPFIPPPPDAAAPDTALGPVLACKDRTSWSSFDRSPGADRSPVRGSASACRRYARA